MKGGKKVEEETKKPCTPVEEAGGDYNELGLYLHSKENNRTLEAAQTLWEFLPGWMAARKMAVYDPDYNRSLSGVIAENGALEELRKQDDGGQAQALQRMAVQQHAGLMGLPIPAALTKAVDILKQRSEEQKGT